MTRFVIKTCQAHLQKFIMRRCLPLAAPLSNPISCCCCRCRCCCRCQIHNLWHSWLWGKKNGRCCWRFLRPHCLPQNTKKPWPVWPKRMRPKCFCSATWRTALVGQCQSLLATLLAHDWKPQAICCCCCWLEASSNCIPWKLGNRRKLTA